MNQADVKREFLEARRRAWAEAYVLRISDKVSKLLSSRAEVRDAAENYAQTPTEARLQDCIFWGHSAECWKHSLDATLKYVRETK